VILGVVVLLSLSLALAPEKTWGFSPQDPFPALINGAGLLCLLGVALGSVVGLTADSLYLDRFHRLGRGASYEGVLATANATAYQDAAALVFAEGVGVDTGSTVGYMEDGMVYCAAPISAAGDDGASGALVQFWAVGLECCAARGNFQCNDVGDAAARSGSVLEVPTEAAHGFRQAIRMMPAVHGLTSDPDALLVHWVASPAAYRESLRESGALLLFGAMLGYLPFAFLGAVVVHQRAQVLTKQRLKDSRDDSTAVI